MNPGGTIGRWPPHEPTPPEAGAPGVWSGTPAAPPTHPVAWFAPAPPKWPAVIGVISIVLAALSLGGMAVSLLMSLAFRSVPMPTPAGGVGPNPALRQFSGPLWWAEVLQWAVAAVCGVLLLLAGLATLRRRAAGRPLHLSFACLFLAYLVGSSVLQVLGLSPAMQRIQASGGGSAALMRASSGMILMGTILNVVILGTYPVFLLLWFMPGRRRPDGGAEFQVER